MELLAQTRAVAGSIGLRIDGPSAKEIDRLLRELGEGFSDWRPAWQRISSEVLAPSIRRAFASHSSQDGEAWAPLSRAYARRKQGGASSMLVASGKLERALTGTGTGALRRFAKKRAVVGTTLGYSVPLQWGYGAGSRAATAAAARGGARHRTRSTGARSDVPARPFISWSDSMREQAADIVVEFLEAKVDEAVAAAAKAGD